MPKASWVKLRDPFQRVIAAGVAIAGEIAHGTEHAEEGSSRGRLQSFTKVAEKSHGSGPEQLVESGKVVSLGCHISLPLSTSCSGPDLWLFSATFVKLCRRPREQPSSACSVPWAISPAIATPAAITR